MELHCRTHIIHEDVLRLRRKLTRSWVLDVFVGRLLLIIFDLLLEITVPGPKLLKKGPQFRLAVPKALEKASEYLEENEERVRRMRGHGGAAAG